MNANDILSSALNHFEQLIRWVYPGLLFVLVLPTAFQQSTSGPSPLTNYLKFYDDASSIEFIGLIIASGFVIYLIERLIIHELVFLWGFLYHIGVGGAVNFKHKTQKTNYITANARFIPIRFGLRPKDESEHGERSEDRYSRYMAGRMAWVHALGSTWMIGATIYVVDLIAPGDGSFTDWASVWVWSYWGVIAALVGSWAIQATISAKSDQGHYPGP